MLRNLTQVKLVVPITLLVLLWCWETWHPLFDQRHKRLRHAARNIAVALLNTCVLAFTFATLTATVAIWVEEHELGLLNQFSLPTGVALLLSVVSLDAYMYLWHRANHAISFLWRFHRMHHSDNRMDVTTATRFHLGELCGSAVLRLAIIPILGLSIWSIVIYETLVLAITQFHHANISIGRLDRVLRMLIVTPDMHKVHHSRLRSETDSNYSTVFSFWDRLGRSFRMRRDVDALAFGLDAFGPRWQSIWGMLKTPFTTPVHDEKEPVSGVSSESR